MILLYPILLLLALALVLTRDRDGGRGWIWFAAWCVAGGAFTFSFLTGLSIGLLVLPLAAAALVSVSVLAPHLAESVGFVAGGGLVLLVVAAINWDETAAGVEPIPWLLAGLAATASAASAYAVARRR